MTNNTQLLPCPFCGVRCKGYPVADTLSVEGDHKTWCPFYYTDPIVKAVDWNTRAPAEDVRAVVEEPVAYAPESALNVLADVGWIHVFKSPGNGGAAVPLYRHPQRPVVLPKRCDENPCQSDADYNSDCGWNACLDAVEELNK